MLIHDFTRISLLEVNSNLSSTLGINFNDSTQPANCNIDFVIGEETYSFPITIKAPIGEIIRAVFLPEDMFSAEKNKLKGMNEHVAKVQYTSDNKAVSQKVFDTANVAMIPNNNDEMRFAKFYLQLHCKQSFIYNLIISFFFIDTDLLLILWHQNPWC